MTALELAKIEQALKTKKDGHSDLTWEEMREFYFMVLAPVPSEYVDAIVHWIVLECKTWRPTTDAIHDYCENLRGNSTANLSLQGARIVREVRDAIREHGINGKPHPERPTITIEGPPPTLSEAAFRFVEFRGGWARLCSEQYGSEEFYIKKCIEDATEVCEQIRIETARQNSIRPDRRMEEISA